MNFIYFSINSFFWPKRDTRKRNNKKKVMTSKECGSNRPTKLKHSALFKHLTAKYSKEKVFHFFQLNKLKKKIFYIVRLLQISKGERARRSHIKKIKEKHRKKWLK